jgi:hypothetical protein
VSEIGGGHFDVEKTRPPFRQTLGNPVSPVSYGDRTGPKGEISASAEKRSDLGWEVRRKGFRKGCLHRVESLSKGS